MVGDAASVAVVPVPVGGARLAARGRGRVGETAVGDTARLWLPPKQARRQPSIRSEERSDEMDLPPLARTARAGGRGLGRLSRAGVMGSRGRVVGRRGGVVRGGHGVRSRAVRSAALRTAVPAPARAAGRRRRVRVLGDTAAVATVPVPARRARRATGRGRRVGVTTVRKTAGLRLPPRDKQSQPRS